MEGAFKHSYRLSRTFSFFFSLSCMPARIYYTKDPLFIFFPWNFSSSISTLFCESGCFEKCLFLSYWFTIVSVESINIELDNLSVLASEVVGLEIETILYGQMA